MNSTFQRFVIGAARRILRPACSSLLPPTAIASLCLAVAGCAGNFTPVQQQQARANNPNTRYTIQDLGVFGANPSMPGGPLVVTNSGWISGAAAVGTAEHAVLYYGGQTIDVGTPALGGNSMGYGVNESGITAGEAEDSSPALSTTEDFCGFQAFGFSSSPTPCVPFVWQNGHMLPLPTLGGVNGSATEINSSGMIGGFAETTTVDPNCPAPQKYQFRPVVWSNGAVHALPTGSDAEGGVWAINDQGQMAGASGPCAPLNFFTFAYFNPTHAWFWQNGVATDLGNLGGQFNNLPHGMNNLGQVVGMSDLAGDQTAHAFLASPGAKMQDLGVVGTDYFSFGFGINDAGEIVGISANADFSVVRAFIRQNATLVDLNSLVTGSNSLYLLTACFVNANGQITGIALDASGQEHAYLATPVPSAAVSSSAVRKPITLPAWVTSQFRLAAHPNL